MDSFWSLLYIELILKSRITQFWSALCCISAFVILIKSWKFKKLHVKDIPSEEKYIACAWFFGALWWFFNGLGLSIYEYNFPLGLLLIKIAGVIVIFHLYFFLPFLLRNIFYNKRVFWLEIIIAIVWFTTMFNYFAHSDLVLQESYSYLREKDPFFTSRQGPPPGILIASIDGVFIFLALFIIYANFKNQKFTFDNLASFYLFYSVLLYGALSLLNLLFINTVSFTYPSFILIPILTYLSYREEKKSKEFRTFNKSQNQ